MAKILILSLGVGRTKNSKTEELKLGDSPYMETYYRLESNIVKSPFVAEALIKKVEPEAILILGTVKSAWGAFFHKYHKEDCGFEKTVEDLENRIKSMGKDSTAEEIDEFQEWLNALYSENLCITGNPKVKVCLTQYGLNETELNNNYIKIRETLKELLDDMREEEVIEISFDITHSFRSMPLYNLVVIDYCRLLMPQKIQIRNVYYGNLDVSSENKEEVPGEEKPVPIAEIVNLKDIIDVLEMTRGINEFTNTGNATSFLKWFDERKGSMVEETHGNEVEYKFIGHLRRFHKAMQMNDRKELMEALKELFDMELPADANTLLDSEKAIQERLRKEIPERPGNIDDPKERQKGKARFQLQLAKWCLKNGQVGLASIIAKEALRSFLVVVYEPVNANPSVNYGYEDENNRKRGEQMLGKKINEQPENPIFISYADIEGKARGIRNTYAHNMEEKPTSPEESNAEEKTILQEKLENPEEIIGKYIGVIEELMKMSKSELEVNFQQPNGQKISSKITRVEVFVTNELSEFPKKRPKSDETKKVYWLEVPQILYNDAKNDVVMQETKKLVYRLGKQLQERHPDLGSLELQVIWNEKIKGKWYVNMEALLKPYMDVVYKMNKIQFYRFFLGEVNDPVSKIQTNIRCLWKIDCEKELNEDVRMRMQSQANDTNDYALKNL